ncbi:MAG: hypothetical protein ACJ74O_18785 [Frankiaceae bacterium]
MTLVPGAPVAGATTDPAGSAASAGRVQPHPVDPRLTRPAGLPAPVRRDLFATYLDHMRRRAGAEAAPHHLAHADFCTRLRMPPHIADSLWDRWIKHYLRYGPDWS